MSTEPQQRRKERKGPLEAALDEIRDVVSRPPRQPTLDELAHLERIGKEGKRGAVPVREVGRMVFKKDIETKDAREQTAVLVKALDEAARHNDIERLKWPRRMEA